MQNEPGSRLTEVSKGDAVDMLAAQFVDKQKAERRSKAQEFIAQEEVDSGIIMSRGSQIRFQHLTFQEYLAAKAIGELEDRDQHQLLLEKNKIYLLE